MLGSPADRLCSGSPRRLPRRGCQGPEYTLREAVPGTRPHPARSCPTDAEHSGNIAGAARGPSGCPVAGRRRGGRAGGPAAGVVRRRGISNAAGPSQRGGPFRREPRSGRVLVCPDSLWQPGRGVGRILRDRLGAVPQRPAVSGFCRRRHSRSSAVRRWPTASRPNWSVAAINCCWWRSLPKEPRP